jgi:hypothetical protein
MSDRATYFTGNIPQFYHHGLGPVFFDDFADDIARRVAASVPIPLVLGNPLIEQIRARGSVDPEQIIERLAEAIPREFGTDPVRLPLQAIVFEARRR